jgi:hypothetical protein
MERFKALADQAVEGVVSREPARRPGLPPELDDRTGFNGA